MFITSKINDFELNTFVYIKLEQSIVSNEIASTVHFISIVLYWQASAVVTYVFLHLDINSLLTSLHIALGFFSIVKLVYSRLIYCNDVKNRDSIFILLQIIYILRKYF